MVLFFWLNVWYSKTILRKETKTCPCSPLGTRTVYCNLSPRGDENRSTFKVIICSMHCIYPRKGTETCGNPPKPPGNRLQFIPVRGRKLVPCFQVFPFQNCNLSPQGGKKAPPPLVFTRSGGALFFGRSSILRSLCGRCSGGNGLADRQRLDALRNIRLHGADLLQIIDHILQGLLNMGCV